MRAIAHPVVRKTCGAGFGMMASAVLIPLLFVKGTELNDGVFPYLTGGLFTTAAVFAISYAASRHTPAAERASIALANARAIERKQLADELDLKIEHARWMLRAIESGYSHSLFEPNTPVLEANLYDLSTDASQWATSVSDKLREAEMFADAMQFAMPDEIDPAEVTAYHVEQMLSMLLKRLDVVIRELREQSA